MKIITYLLTSISLFLLPIKGLLITMIMFIVLDSVMAIYVAVKLGGWNAFKSTKFFNIVVKSFFYLFTIILAYFVDIFMFEGSILDIKLLLAKSMTSAWVFIEVKSCDENSMKLGNKSLWVLIKSFTTKIKSIKKDLNDII